MAKRIFSWLEQDSYSSRLADIQAAILHTGFFHLGSKVAALHSYQFLLTCCFTGEGLRENLVPHFSQRKIQEALPSSTSISFCSSSLGAQLRSFKGAQTSTGEKSLCGTRYSEESSAHLRDGLTRPHLSGQQSACALHALWWDILLHSSLLNLPRWLPRKRRKLLRGSM